jgi:hypothetical protein
MMQRGRFAKSYARSPPIKNPYDRVLIVCEGAKTEPKYFRGIRIRHGLSSIEIERSRGTDPITIVAYTLDRLNERDRFDKAFCVFDRDRTRGNANFDTALTQIRESPAGRANKLRAVFSCPCFEVWVLLHFVYHDGPFNDAGGRSPCDNVLRMVKDHLIEYDKDLQPDVLDALIDKSDFAIANARRLETHNRATGSPNPATSLHILVDYLRNLKSRKANAG